MCFSLPQRGTHSDIFKGGFSVNQGEDQRILSGQCGPLNNGPQRCPRPNSWNLWLCHLTWQRVFADMIMLRALRWELILDYLVALM